MVAGNNTCTGSSLFTSMLATMTRDDHRVLELIPAEIIAAAAAGGPERLLVARGFSPEILAGLVRSGLAGVTAERADSGPKADMVFRLWITQHGMQALQAAGRAITSTISRLATGAADGD